jgi:hypothetical protein
LLQQLIPQSEPRPRITNERVDRAAIDAYFARRHGR